MLALDTFVHAVHVLSAVVWVGGMLFLSLALAPILRSDCPVELRALLIRKVAGRFQKMGWTALGFLAVTGVYKLWSVWSTVEWTHSAFGAALAIKLLLVALMLALTALHDFIWGPGLVKESNPQERQRLSTRLAFWARINVTVAVTIVLLGAFLRMNPF